MLVSYCCCNKLQTWWLQKPQICSFTALEVRSPKSKYLRAVFLLDALGENLFLWILPAFLGLRPLPPFKASLVAYSNLSLTRTLLPLSSKDPRDYMGPLWIIQNNLPTSISLTACASPFCKQGKHIHSFPRLTGRHLWGPEFYLPQSVEVLLRSQLFYVDHLLLWQRQLKPTTHSYETHYLSFIIWCYVI